MIPLTRFLFKSYRITYMLKLGYIQGYKIIEKLSKSIEPIQLLAEHVKLTWHHQEVLQDLKGEKYQNLYNLYTEIVSMYRIYTIDSQYDNIYIKIYNPYNWVGGTKHLGT